MKHYYKIFHIISDVDGNFIRKYEYCCRKNYESTQDEMSKLFDTFTATALVDPDLKRTFLKYDKDELKFMDEIDVSNLYPNVEIHSFKIIKD